jgi:hypothetical protein
MNDKYITFFHTSPHHIQLFFPKNIKRPLFYWFGNCYFSLFGAGDRQEYFYLFVKNPQEDDIAFRARNDEQGFDGLYRNYLDYLKEQKKMYAKGTLKYNEPAILMSFSKIIPNLTLKYDKKDKTYTVITPIEYKGTKINLHDENDIPLNFLEIPEIIEILPNINNSHPFIDAKIIGGKYTYNDWIPMVTEKMGTWL